MARGFHSAVVTDPTYSLRSSQTVALPALSIDASQPFETTQPPISRSISGQRLTNADARAASTPRFEPIGSTSTHSWQSLVPGVPPHHTRWIAGPTNVTNPDVDPPDSNRLIQGFSFDRSDIVGMGSQAGHTSAPSNGAFTSNSLRLNPRTVDPSTLGLPTPQASVSQGGNRPVGIIAVSPISPLDPDPSRKTAPSQSRDIHQQQRNEILSVPLAGAPPAQHHSPLNHNASLVSVLSNPYNSSQSVHAQSRSLPHPVSRISNVSTSGLDFRFYASDRLNSYFDNPLVYGVNTESPLPLTGLRSATKHSNSPLSSLNGRPTTINYRHTLRSSESIPNREFHTTQRASKDPVRTSYEPVLPAFAIHNFSDTSRFTALAQNPSRFIETHPPESSNCQSPPDGAHLGEWHHPASATSSLGNIGGIDLDIGVNTPSTNTTAENAPSIPKKRGTYRDNLHCPFCNINWPSSDEYKSHMYGQHSPFVCPTCQKESGTLSEFRKHQNTHSRSHHCECGSRFNYKKDLLRHRKSHSNRRDRMFHCQFKPCSHVTVRKDNLKRHEKVCQFRKSGLQKGSEGG